MENKKLIGLVIVSLIVVTSLSIVLAYSVRDVNPVIVEEAEYSTLEKGALPPEPSKGIVAWSNPRYKDGTMIDWESKR